MKRIAVFGSTGSIGTQTLDVISREPDRFSAEILVAGKNDALMERQIRQFHPRKAVMGDPEAAVSLKVRVADLDVEIGSGMDAVAEAASDQDIDLVLMALVGMIGIRPTVAALTAGHKLALANKETLVCAGHLIMNLSRDKGISILPVDSEHSAIFQCIGEHPASSIEQILLTASGGPFFGKDTTFLKTARLEQALNHPNWSMGQKVTIDSASMVNKGLEVIEAKWLFDTPVERIKVLVQRESYVHSMVQFVDGSVLAQIAPPDMRVPISYALGYPEHFKLPVNPLDFAKIGGIQFFEPDLDTFRGLALGYEAGRVGGSLPAVFNAANEKAVQMYAVGKIGFLTIYEIIEDCMTHHHVIESPSLQQIFDCEQETYERIESRWE